ncbi:MAG: aldehyde dehydrogenase family protein, partial [Muribaculaceae bacterium]|nr:aldehyde dehydrogenase family protein [Muribaculaceae bacterium]
MKNLKMYIDGKFVESKSGKWIDVLNPSTEEVIARQPEGTKEDVEEALDAARKAQKAWEKTPAIQRAGYLLKMAEGIKERRNEFIEIIMREQGKTRNWATIEVDATISYFEYMATFARHIEGEIIPSDNVGETILLTKKPIGVVAGILPWNFPFFLIARKAGAALIAGCSIVLKPSQLTPENCCVFAEVVDKTGLPAGLFNVVTGKGSVVGHELAASPKIDIVSVTGSVGAGESIMKDAAGNITKVSLELGGKAPVIVFPDADLELAAQAVLDSRIGNNGQICNNAE